MSNVYLQTSKFGADVHRSRQNPVALITGATSGIGAEIARKLHLDGFTVAISGRSEERGNALARDLGAGATFFNCDLRAPNAPLALVKQVTQLLGPLDVLVNNAAVDHTNDLLAVTDEEIRETFESNTFAPMNLLIAAARSMSEHGTGGAIINVTSRLASIGVPTMGIYSASKGAMLAFTKAAAVELARHDIRVNAVAPGMTRTPLYDEWLAALPSPEAEAAKVSAAIPLGRIAETQDVASTVAFLASPAAAYLTGVSIPVDGGYLAQ